MIDYLALDTEGTERLILMGHDFSAYTITAISIEGHECTDLLLANGYVQVTNPFTDADYECYFVRRS